MCYERLPSPPLLIISLIFQFMFRSVSGLAVKSPPIYIQPVETAEDWQTLADIRYDEWILPKEAGRSSSTSRTAFRLATRDIYEEERPKSLLYLAKRQHEGNVDRSRVDGSDMTTVGAAEMSPYEVQVAWKVESIDVNALYATDVVTVSQYRRQGIARQLMLGLEEEALAKEIHRLVLNVAKENISALKFYKSLGYRKPSTRLLSCLDIGRLEEEAGTKGQLFLEKCLLKDDELFKKH